MAGKMVYYCDRRFLVPLIIGFTMGFVVQINFFILRTQGIRGHKDFLPKHGVLDLDFLDAAIYNEIDYDDLPFSTPNYTNASENVNAREVFNQTYQPKILCWVMSKSAILNGVIRKTWGRRCDYLVFMVSENQPEYAADEVKLNVSAGLFTLKPTYWHKAREAWCYIYKYYLQKADWFLTTQHDSYVVIENLRHYLKSGHLHKYPSNSIYFGRAFKGRSYSYISSTPGYVVSRGALVKFGKTYSKTGALSTDWLSFRSSDSISLGYYMNNIGVKAIDARDVSSRLLFLPKSLDALILKESLEDDLEPVQKGMDCCSDVAIIFHVSKSNSFRVYEYFLYHFQPYGIDHSSPPQ